MENRFKICAECTAIIDILMDIAYKHKKKESKYCCAGCFTRLPYLAADYEMIPGHASAPKGFKTELDDLKIAPKGTLYICLHCAKTHKNKQMLETLCNSKEFFPRLIYAYSIKLDDRGNVILSEINFYGLRDN